MTEEDFKRLMAEYTEETRRHFDIAVESIKASNAIVAEGVVATNERVQRLEATVGELTNEIRTEFANTRAMITFSHSELDR